MAERPPAEAGQARREEEVDAVEDETIQTVVGHLQDVPALGCRAMFGAYGLYQGPRLFGIASGGRLFFKTDAATAHEYLRRGMRPYRPDGEVLRTFYEVPRDVVGDPRRLAAWARAAAACAAGWRGGGAAQRGDLPPRAEAATAR